MANIVALILILFSGYALADPISAAIATAAATGAGYATGAVITLSSIATVFAINLALTGVAKILAPTPRKITGSTINNSQTIMVRNSLESRNVIYGETRASGTIVYAQNTGQYLNLIVAVACHEIDSFQKFYFNDEELTIGGTGLVTAPSKYNGKALILYRTGTDNQEAIDELVSLTSEEYEDIDGVWTSDHRLRGIAYIYVRLSNAPEVFNGIPNISALIRGKKLYDPRTLTTAYSSNPALVLYDYLTNSRYGLKLSTSEIDTASFISAANICDETVNRLDGTTENRYETHGVLSTGQSFAQNIEKILSSYYGMMYYSGGAFHTKPGSYQTPTITLTEDDIISDIVVETKQSRRDNANVIRGTFISEDDNYQAVDYPPAVSETFLEEDGGIENSLDYPLPLTKSHTMAQRIAKIALYRNREQITIRLKTNLKNGFQLEVGDNVYLTIDRYGWSSKVFQVAQWALGISTDALTVDLTLREISSDVYAWDENIDESVFATNNTQLFAIDTLPTPGITLSEELRVFNEKVITVIIIDITTSSPFSSYFEVEIKKNVDTQWISLGSSSSERFEYIDAQDGVVYNVRARSVGSFQQLSEYRTVNITPVGKTAPPSDVSNFSANVIGDQTILSWDAVTDLDLSHYVIRFRDGYETSVPNTYANSRTLFPKIPRPATSIISPSLTGTYYIKAVDKLGFESLNSKSVITTTKNTGYSGLQSGNKTISTLQEDTSFSGNKDDVVLVDGQLVLDSSILFDDALGDFDDTIGYFDGGGGYVDNEGEYVFYNSLDLGDIYTVKLTSSISVERKDYVNLFDDASGNFDDRSGLFDGDQQESGKTNVDFYVSYTDDDPADISAVWSNYVRFIAGNYSARGFRFKAILQSSDASATPAINQLRVYASMDYTSRYGDDIASGVDAGGKAITFSPAYYPFYGTSSSNNVNLNITAQDMNTGDYYIITNKSEDGFTITFRDSGGTIVNRTFDYDATGLSELNA